MLKQVDHVLAKDIDACGTDQETLKVAAPVPVLKRARPQCACESKEGCHVCGRCLEQHCICGDHASASSARMCQESRACNCMLVNPRQRCSLCLGCRQETANVYSHCRCLQHQERYQQLKRKHPATRRPHDGTRARSRQRCRCFSRGFSSSGAIGHAVGGRESAKRRRFRIARLSRGLGIPSTANVYQKKITPTVTVHSAMCALESDADVDSDVENRLVEDTAEEEVRRILHKSIIPSWVRTSENVPQQPLPKHSSVSTYLESIDPNHAVPRTGVSVRHGRRLPSSTVTRVMENASFVHDRSAAMPSEDIVDYVVYASSVKVSRVPELLGSLDDSAAIAIGITVEEYIKQLVDENMDAGTYHTDVITRANVRAFAQLVLRDFNWASYLAAVAGKCTDAADLTPSQANEIISSLVAHVYEEFRSGVCCNEIARAQCDRDAVSIRDWISGVVEFELDRVRNISKSQQKPVTIKTAFKSVHSETTEGRSAKLGVHPSRVTGRPLYRYEISRDIGGQHHARIIEDGLETQEQAIAAMDRARDVLDQENVQRSLAEKPPPTEENPIVDELYESIKKMMGKASASGIDSSDPNPSGSHEEA